MVEKKGGHPKCDFRVPTPGINQKIGSKRQVEISIGCFSIFCQLVAKFNDFSMFRSAFGALLHFEKSIKYGRTK